MNLLGSTWELSRSDGTVLGHVELKLDGIIGLYQNYNESFWAADGVYLYFLNGAKNVTTQFRCDPSSPDRCIGDHQGKTGHHILKKIDLDQKPYPAKTSFTLLEPLVIKDTPAYCLTVDGDRRRQHHCVSEIDWMGFKETRMIFGQRETECPSGYTKRSFYGSSKNHHQALRDMKARGDSYAAFFEDDLILPAWYDIHMPKVLEALAGTDWHILFLKSGNEGNIIGKLGSINRLKGGPIIGMQYLIRDSGGFLDYLLALTVTGNPLRRVQHSEFRGRYTIDWLLHHNLAGWNVFGAAMDLTIHDQKLFSQRSLLEP